VVGVLGKGSAMAPVLPAGDAQPRLFVMARRCSGSSCVICGGDLVGMFRYPPLNLGSLGFGG
jgi:hypothetical protein